MAASADEKIGNFFKKHKDRIQTSTSPRTAHDVPKSGTKSGMPSRSWAKKKERPSSQVPPEQMTTARPSSIQTEIL